MDVSYIKIIFTSFRIRKNTPSQIARAFSYSATWLDPSSILNLVSLLHLHVFVTLHKFHFGLASSFREPVMFAVSPPAPPPPDGSAQHAAMPQHCPALRPSRQLDRLGHGCHKVLELPFFPYAVSTGRSLCSTHLVPALFIIDTIDCYGTGHPNNHKFIVACMNLQCIPFLP